MSRYIAFKGGRRACQLIRDRGFSSDHVKVMAGASGAAKWLVISDLDRFLFSEWFKGRKKPLFLAGTSIGAWRFASAACPDPKESLLKLEDCYINQTYKGRPTKREVTEFGWKVADLIFDEKSISHAVKHPVLRLNIIASKSRSLMASSSPIVSGAGFGISIMANSIRRKFLGSFFERALFSDHRNLPPFYDMKCFPIKKIRLSNSNLREAVMASSAIPFMTEPLTDIKGAPTGIYRDGGILDYNLDIPFLPESSEDLVFYPHYSSRIIPGWFDKKLRHRKPKESNMSNVLYLYPSEKFIKLLPYGRIPDRKDFAIFSGNDNERIKFWKKAADMGRILTEEFRETVESGSIRNLIRPIL